MTQNSCSPSSATRWRQVERRILDLAESVAPGGKLPSERELSRMFHVQRGTVRRSLESLIQRRVLDRRPPLGTFVAARLKAQPVALLQFHMPTSSDPVYLTHIEGIQQGLSETGRQLLALLVLRETPRSFLLDTLDSARPAGLLLDRFIDPDDAGLINDLARRYPCVAIGKGFRQTPMPCVRAEHQKSTASLARCLSSAGCKSLLLLGGNPTHLGMRQRSDAFTTAATALGFDGLETLWKPLPPEYPVEAPAYWSRVRDALRRAPKPVGVFAVLLIEAQEVRRMAEEEGLVLGQDIRIATVPPSPALAECAGMALAVRDEVAIGREAAQLLLRRIAGQAAENEIVDVPCRLVLPGLEAPEARAAGVQPASSPSVQ